MSLTKESVAVVTGAGSGIGRALAIRLSREPIAGIAIADIDPESLAETEKMIGESGLKVTIHYVDVADEGRMRAFAAEVVELHGRATHIINNAGVALGGNLKDVSIDDIRWLMDINFWGVVYGTKFFLPYLEKESSAHIVNFSSLYGLIAPPGQAAYAASKFAVRGFTETLRHELAGTNIAVSVVHPGGVKTNIANAAKIGAGVALTKAQLAAQKEKMNRNLSRTTPQRAAEIIVRGIKRRNPRILVGTDARLLGFIGRMLPRRYFGLIDLISGGRLKND